MERKKYTFEFKKEIVDLLLSGLKSARELEGQYGVQANIIQRWKREFTDGSYSNSFSREDRERQKLEAELARYKQKVGELLLENELLKKFQEEISQRRKSANLSVITGRNWAAWKKGAK